MSPYPLTLLGTASLITGCRPTTKTVACRGTNNQVILWDTATGQRRVLGSHSQPVTNFAFSPDGKALATASNDCLVRVWDVGTGAVESHSCHQQAVYSVAFASSDGTKLVSGGQRGELWWWDRTAKKGTRVTGHRDDETICCLTSSPDFRRLISGTVWGIRSEAIIWDISGGAPVASGEPVDAGSVVSSISISPESEHFALGLIQPKVRIRRLSDSAEERTLVGEGPWMSGAAFSPNGEHFVTAAASGQLRIYRNWRAPNVDRDVTVFRTADAFRRVEFFPNGKAFVTASMDGNIRVWRLEEPVRKSRLLSDGKRWVSTLYASSGCRPDTVAP